MSIFTVVLGKQYTLRGMIDYIFDEYLHDNSIIAKGYVYTRPDDPVLDMLLTKAIFNKTNGNEYEQLILSFEGYEYDSDDICSDLYKNEHMRRSCSLFAKVAQLIVEHTHAQLVYAVHGNTSNLHAHYIINSVRMDDGRKVQLNKKSLLILKSSINLALQEHGFSTIRSRHDPNNYFFVTE